MPAPTENWGNDPTKGAQIGRRVSIHQLSDAIRKNKVMLIDRFAAIPSILQYGTGDAPVSVPALPTAVVKGVDILLCPDALGDKYIELYQTTAQSLMPLRHATKGLDIAGDKVDNEAVEYIFGGNHANNPLGFLAGTDPGIVLDCVFEITDVTGTDQFGIFLRKQEDYAVPASFLSGGDPTYTDIVLLGFAGTAANPSLIRQSSDVGNSGVATVQSTAFGVADGGIVRLTMKVVGRTVQIYINGVRLGNPIAYDGAGTAITSQFAKVITEYVITSGLFMIPGIFLRNDTTTPGTVFLKSAKIYPAYEEGEEESQRPQ